MIVEEIPPTATAKGHCDRCEKWCSGRIIAEVHGDTGAGGTVVRCPACVKNPRRRHPAYVRRYSD